MQKTILLAFKQALLIAYLTGFLWLRRNPMSMVFTAISPFSLLFVLFVISNGHYIQFAIAGSLVMALVGYGLALGQDISFYKTEYKIQDVFVASPVSPLTYMTGLAFSELLFGLPALIVLTALAAYLWDFPCQPTSALIKYCLNLGSHVSNGVFFVIPYATYEKCDTGNFFCKCNLGSNTASLLFNRTFTFGVTLPCLPVTHDARLNYIAIYYGPSNTERMVCRSRNHCPLVYLVGLVLLAKTKAIWRER